MVDDSLCSFTAGVIYATKFSDVERSVSTLKLCMSEVFMKCYCLVLQRRAPWLCFRCKLLASLFENGDSYETDFLQGFPRNILSAHELEIVPGFSRYTECR